MFLGDVARRMLMSLAAETKLLGDFSVSQVSSMGCSPVDFRATLQKQLPDLAITQHGLSRSSYAQWIF